MLVLLEHTDVKVSIEELLNGKRCISIVPIRERVFIPIRYYETNYPVDLIKLILRAKGPYVIDEIRERRIRVLSASV
jgi:hypothetical protein